MRFSYVATCVLAAMSVTSAPAATCVGAETETPATPVLRVKPVADFEVTGDGSAPAWQQAEWAELRKRPDAHHEYTAKIKVLYSKSGLYCLMSGTDSLLTATFRKDFEDLWTEDVYEVFLWTDQRHPIYFEYEISPLGRELPIIIPNLDGQFLGWRPWRYEGARRIRKAVSVAGGLQRSGAKIRGWTAEFFIPFQLLKPLRNVPPQAGRRWRANFYRVDHDGGKKTAWDWSRVGPSFHEYQKFGTLVFD